MVSNFTIIRGDVDEFFSQNDNLLSQTAAPDCERDISEFCTLTPMTGGNGNVLQQGGYSYDRYPFTHSHCDNLQGTSADSCWTTADPSYQYGGAQDYTEDSFTPCVQTHRPDYSENVFQYESGSFAEYRCPPSEEGTTSAWSAQSSPASSPKSKRLSNTRKRSYTEDGQNEETPSCSRTSSIPSVKAPKQKSRGRPSTIEIPNAEKLSKEELKRLRNQIAVEKCRKNKQEQANAMTKALKELRNEQKDNAYQNEISKLEADIAMEKSFLSRFMEDLESLRSQVHSRRL